MKKHIPAKTADINRGWGLTCSKSCAAKKREKNRENYDVLKVKTNNMKRELWNNKYRNIELKLRKKHKNWSTLWLFTNKIIRCC